MNRAAQAASVVAILAGSIWAWFATDEEPVEEVGGKGGSYQYRAGLERPETGAAEDSVSSGLIAAIGRVRDWNGSPLAEAIVDIVAVPEKAWQLSERIHCGSTVTEVDGRFRVEFEKDASTGQPNVTFLATARREGHVGAMSSHRGEHVGDIVRFAIELEPARCVRGRAIDSSGAPVAHAVVTVGTRQTQSNFDGWFEQRVDELNDRFESIGVASHPAHGLSSRFRAPLQGGGDIDVGEVVLDQRQPAVSGYVRFADGTPADGLNLLLTRADEAPRLRSPTLGSALLTSVTTDRDGWFEAYDLANSIYDITLPRDRIGHGTQLFEDAVASFPKLESGATHGTAIRMPFHRLVIRAFDSSGTADVGTSVRIACWYPDDAKLTAERARRGETLPWAAATIDRTTRTKPDGVQAWVPAGAFVHIETKLGGTPVVWQQTLAERSTSIDVALRAR